MGMRLAYCRAVEKLDLWDHEKNLSVPQVTMEVFVEDDVENWILATIGIQHLDICERLTASLEKALERVLSTKVSRWNIANLRPNVDEPRAIEDRFVFGI